MSTTSNTTEITKTRDGVVTCASITMTRVEAETLYREILQMQRENTTRSAAIDRKRSWPLSVQAMAKADCTMRAEALTKLRERAGTASNIGGY